MVLCQDSRALLIDFSIAVACDNGDEMQTTAGTPGYAAPELLRGSYPASSSSQCPSLKTADRGELVELRRQVRFCGGHLCGWRVPLCLALQNNALLVREPRPDGRQHLAPEGPLAAGGHGTGQGPGARGQGCGGDRKRVHF